VGKGLGEHRRKGVEQDRVHEGGLLAAKSGVPVSREFSKERVQNQFVGFLLESTNPILTSFSPSPFGRGPG